MNKRAEGVMGVHVIKVPDIGEGIAEVELVEWHVQPGDKVVEDQRLADVMTDKATVEIPSPVAGKVMALGGKVGQVMAVGSELIRIEVENTGNAGAGPGPATRVAPPATSQTPELVRTVSVPVDAPPAANLIRQPDDKRGASPAVRRRARALGIELKDLRSSDAAGRILHEDLDAYIAHAASPLPVHGRDVRYRERHEEEAAPIIGLRRKIAEKMREAKRRIPHFTYVEEVDVTELEVLRARLNDKHGAERIRLTLLPLLIRAIVLAVREFPQINAHFDDEAGVVTRFGAVHVGIATQTEAGLMVPVLRHAETRDPWSSAAEIARLAEAARTGKATREELTGSTITISSLGALGGIVSTPVINHPEVAIVGVNRIVERPVMRGGGVVPRQMMNLSSSFDHRVVDGLPAAKFVQAVRRFLECPAMLFIE